MSFNNMSNHHGFRIEIDCGGYRLSQFERDKMEKDLDTLGRTIRAFPVAELKVELTILNSTTVRVATALRLVTRTLYVADQDGVLHPAWERCIRRLVKKVGALKDKLANKPAYSKQQEGTQHEVRPAVAPDAEAFGRAVHDRDYAAFREALMGYEEPIQRRVGRWVQRYPEAQDLLGTDLTISEIVEEVFLNAFEQFEHRPHIALGQWLEQLIDESVRMLLTSEEERENLRMIQSARGAALDETAAGNELGRL